MKISFYLALFFSLSAFSGTVSLNPDTSYQSNPIKSNVMYFYNYDVSKATHSTNQYIDYVDKYYAYPFQADIGTSNDNILQSGSNSTGLGPLIYVTLSVSGDISGSGSYPAVSAFPELSGGSFDDDPLPLYANGITCYESDASGACKKISYTEGVTITIAIPPNHICDYLFDNSKSAEACGDDTTKGYVNNLTTENTKQDMTIRFQFEKSSNDSTVITETDTTYELTIRFHRYVHSFSTTNTNCSSLDCVFSESYRPFTESIYLNPVKYGLYTAPTSSYTTPILDMFAGVTKGGTANFSSTFRTGNGSYTSFALTNEDHRIDGFTDSTEGNYVDHGLAVIMRDYSGVLIGQRWTGIRTAKVLGLLEGNECFIATATYGTNQGFFLDTLREFRSKILLKTELGTRFVKWYYSWSPEKAKWLKDKTALKFLVKLGLTPLTILCAILLSLFSYPWVSAALLFGVGSLVVWRKKGVLA